VKRSWFILCFAIVALATLAGFAQNAANPVYERRIVTVGDGPQRLAIDAGLLAGSAPFRVVKRGDRSYAVAGLTDLRLVTGDGRPVPHLLIEPPVPAREWLPGRVLPVAATKKTSGFEIDLGGAHVVDLVRLDGIAAPYLKRMLLEGSGDRERWTTLVAEATLFDLPDEGLRQTSLAFAAGPYRYLRITWDDTNSARIANPATVEARSASPVTIPPPTTFPVTIERRPSEPGLSRFRIRLPGPRLPVVALDLDIGPGTTGGRVYRQAVVSESRFAGLEAAPVDLGRVTLTRITREGLTASALRVPIAAPSEAELELTIDDGANEALDVRRVSVVLAELPWIYFEAPAGPVIARYGDVRLAAPVYDLEAARNTIELAKLPEAKFADGGALRAAAPPAAEGDPVAVAPGPALDAAAFKFARAIESALEGGQKVSGLVALPLDSHALAHSRGAASRFADVRVLDASGRQVPYIVERRNEPLSVALTLKPASEEIVRQVRGFTDTAQRSVYTVSLPDAPLPAATIVLETSARVFQRTVRLGVVRPADRDRREPYFDARQLTTWRNADEQAPTRALALRLDSLPERDLVLVVDEGDNPALPLTGVRLLLPSYRLRFYHDAGAALRLAYGRTDLQPPQYDLALLAPRVMGAAAREVAVAAAGAATPSDVATGFASPRAFWLVLGGAVLVLLALIVRLIRTA
jgi:hypothetical protein